MQVTCHVDTHICRGFIRAAAHDLLNMACTTGENFYVTVVVDGSFAVSLQMERVDHVDIVQICSGSFVGKVYRMFQRKVPDREGLKFCIAGFLLLVCIRGKAGKGRLPSFHFLVPVL